MVRKEGATADIAEEEPSPVLDERSWSVEETWGDRA